MTLWGPWWRQHPKNGVQPERQGGWGLWCPREKLQGLTHIFLYRQECLHKQQQSWLLISVIPVHLRRPVQMDTESVCCFTIGCQINVFLKKCLNPPPHIFGMYDATFQTIAFPLCDCVVVFIISVWVSLRGNEQPSPFIRTSQHSTFQMTSKSTIISCRMFSSSQKSLHFSFTQKLTVIRT